MLKLMYLPAQMLLVLLTPGLPFLVKNKRT